MSVTLKEETILNQWSSLVDDAAGHATELVADIKARLQAAEIPGGCNWTFDEVKSQGWFSKVRRDFLIIRLEEFSDYRQYVGVRPYGRYLDACRFLTCEPGFFKKKIAEKLAGEGNFMALSGPKNILIEQDLTAWTTVVHHCVLDAVYALVKQLGQDPSGIRRDSKGMLEIW